MRHCILTITLMVVVAIAISAKAMALAGEFTPQKSTLQLEKQYSVSGSWVHVVKKENLNDFTSRGSQVIADFPSRESAVEAAQKLNDGLRGDDVYAWIYMASTRPKETGANDPVVPNSSSIKKPKLSFVDPGPSASAGSGKRDADSLLKTLLGRKGIGMLGSKRAEIAVDEQGNVRFSGEVKGTGVLKVVDGELIIDGKSNASTVRFNGETIFGITSSKANPDLRAKWWFRLNELFPETEESSPLIAPTERSNAGTGNSLLSAEPTVWIRFSASGHESRVNNVSVHFHALVLYPDHTFIEYMSISSYLGTLSKEGQSLDYYYGPDRLAGSPYVGGSWREEDGFVKFTTETVNQNEKKKTKGIFAYKREDYLNRLGKYAIEPARLAIKRGAKSEYDFIQHPFYEKHFGSKAQEARGSDELVGL